MEISTAPRPSPATPWGRTLLCAAVLAPLVGLVLLPLGLGLERYVVTGASANAGEGVPRGSLLLERVVPASDLRPGDLVTVEAPTGTVTHRIASIGGEGIRTVPGPASDRPQLLPGDPVALSRVEVVLPGVGWLHLLLSSRAAWPAVGVSLLALGLLSSRGREALTAFWERREGLNAAR